MQPLELFQCDFWWTNVRPNRKKDCSIPVSIQQLLFLFFKDHHNCSITMYLWFYAWSTDLEGESLILNHHVSEPDTPNGLLHRIIWKRCFQKIGIGCTVWPDRTWTPWFWCHNPATTTPAQFLNAVGFIWSETRCRHSLHLKKSWCLATQRP